MLSSLIRYLVRHHVGLLALFVAVGGTAYAAAALPANSVGTRQLRRHAVTLAKIDPHARNALRGRKGQTGPTGPKGQTGPTGPSDGYSTETDFTSFDNTDSVTSHGVSLTVPAGSYVATGDCKAAHLGPMLGTTMPVEFALAQSSLTAGSGQTYSAEASVPDLGDFTIVTHQGDQIGYATLSISGGFYLPNGGTITEQCSGNGGTVQGTSLLEMGFGPFHLTATRVGALHQQASSGP